jgi:hypothetical protein
MEENHRSNVVEDSKENALAIHQFLCICIMQIEPTTYMFVKDCFNTMLMNWFRSNARWEDMVVIIIMTQSIKKRTGTTSNWHERT